MDAKKILVEISQLRKSFGSNEVLKGIDLQVHAAEVIATLKAEPQHQEKAKAVAHA